MLWKEFLHGLDAARSKIRLRVTMMAPVDTTEPVILELRHLLNSVDGDKPRTVLVELPADEEGNPIYPYQPPQAAQKAATVDESPNDGSPRAVVLPRTTPRGKHPINIEETTEDKLGKG